MLLLGEIAWTEGADVVFADRSVAAAWPSEPADAAAYCFVPGFYDNRRGREWDVAQSRFLIWFGGGDNPVDVWRIDTKTVLLQQCFLDDHGDPEREAALRRSLAA